MAATTKRVDDPDRCKRWDAADVAVFEPCRGYFVERYRA
jgi:hypothetical protein